jgi:phosphoglycerol transferase MdoB-like AlkP superfamily enzyme
LLLFILLVAISLATRVGIVLLADLAPTTTFSEIVRAFVAGAARDVLVALWLTVPFVMWGSLVPRSSRSPTRPYRARRAGIAVAIYAALFVAAAELFFFQEFDGRFNFVAVDYLIYPTEVVADIRQSYPLPLILASLAAVTGVIVVALRPTFARLDVPRLRTRRWALMSLAMYVVFLAALTETVGSSRWHISDDRVVNEIAANGYQTFWMAFRGQDAPYEGMYATLPDSTLFPRLHRLLAEPASRGVAFDDRGTERLVRAIRPQRRLNVVVILEESLGSAFIGALHPEDSTLTPRFDSLAREGVLLTHMYSTGNRTIRALEATTASIPPLPGISIVRRPASEHLFTLPSILASRGYATEFIYGGRALFDGMRRYMLHNGMERVIEQADFPDSTFRTAWGVSDEAIFDRALSALDSLHATGKPFYSLILSVSNHKPYTYPAGRIAADPAQRRRANAVRYSDYALGRFMRDVRTHAFFDSTLFVIMGDHGARVYGAAEIPLASYEVPVLLYGPAIVPAGQRVSTMASSMDIPPTILAMLGVTYRSRFFGRDILSMSPDEGRAVMTHNSSIALLRDSRMTVLGPRQTVTAYVADTAGRWLRQRDIDPAARDGELDAVAFFDGADRVYRRGAYTFPVSQRRMASGGASP